MTEIPAHYEAPPVTECLKTLSAPVPPELIRHRQQGGTDLSYLERFTVNRLLDARAPGWWGDVRSITTTADTVIVCYRISIPSAEGWLHREAVGSDKPDQQWLSVLIQESYSLSSIACLMRMPLNICSTAAILNH